MSVRAAVGPGSSDAGGPVRAKIHHIGIVVDDLAEMRAFLEAALGLHLVEERSFPDDLVETAYFSYDGGTQIELVELGEPGARARRLGGAGPSRLEHIAVEVDDLDAIRPQLAAAGIVMQTDEPQRSGDTRALFSRPETSRGIVLQVLDRKVPDAT